MSNQRSKRRRRLYSMYKDCCYCGRFLTFEQFTIEHITPRKAGGDNDPNNIEVCCGKCNQNHDNIHKLWHFISTTSNKREDIFYIKLHQLYNLLNKYIYNCRRRIRHPIYDIYPAVKFLHSFQVVEGTQNAEPTRNESSKSCKCKCESRTTTTILFLPRLIRNYCDKFERFCIGSSS